MAKAATAGVMVLSFTDAEMVLWLGGASTGLGKVTFDKSRPVHIGRHEATPIMLVKLRWNGKIVDSD